MLQSSLPLRLDESWIEGAAGLVTGSAPGDGQGADHFVVENRTFLRG